MKRVGLVWLMVIFCLSQNIASAQNISNEGTDFWAVFPSHDPFNTEANITIYITSKENSHVTVSCGTYSETQSIPANTAVPFTVTRDQAYIERIEANAILNNRAIHIKVTDGFPKVVAYAHIFAGRRSAASLILPVESLGQKYYSMNYTQDNQGRNYLTLVATEADTKLLLHELNGNILTINFTNAGDVYEYMLNNRNDLTGLYVEVDEAQANSCTKRFAAFSGSTSLTIECGDGRDPLYQQLYPTNSWGKEYGAAPFIDRKYIIRVLAAENNTSVNFNGQNFVLNKGEYLRQTDLIEPSYISSNKVISVAQYSYTQDCSAIGGGAITGDPDMVLLNPIEFNIKNVTMFSSDAENIVEKYINVVMKTSATGTFKINGSVPSGSWKIISANPLYSYIQVPINTLSSNLSANDGFNAIAYGFGRNESYAYSAGTNLATNNYLLIKNNVTNLDAPSACVGQPSDFKLVLPTPAISIIWQLDGGNVFSSPVTSPTIITGINGAVLYEYTYAANMIFPNVSQHIMTVKVQLQTVGTCLGNQNEYTYNFDVDPVPVAAFDPEKLQVCENDGIKFIDASSSQSPTKSVNKWVWDFGDNSPVSTEQNPVHKYTRSGSYEVKLSAGVDGGCMSDILPKLINVTVIPSPSIVFDAIDPICINAGSITVNQARETKGIPGSWTYSGNGITSTGLFDPKIAGLGIHTITYTFDNPTGCNDFKTQTIAVLDTAKFDLDKDIYILKGGEKRLDIRTYGPNANYKWSPSDGLSRDDVLNPVIFSSEQDREYTLTSVTDGNCSTTRKIIVHMIEKLEPSNAFSPNGDGKNDVWNIKYIETYPHTNVQIFNRYGQRVFYSDNYSASVFTGHFNGEALPVGTYYYIIDPKNGKPRLTGPLTLIR